MPPSKSRSGSSDTSNNRAVHATPNVGKIGRVGSTKMDSGKDSPLQKSRTSPKSVEPKPPVERRVLKVNSIAPEKQSRGPKGSELQAKLGEFQEDLKKAKEQLAFVEQEKARVVEELNGAKKLADETNEKLKEALAFQKNTEESSEIEKSRADESLRKREEELVGELERIKEKQSADTEALQSVSKELQKVKDELEVVNRAKISALSQAEDAMRIAKTNAEKVETLSGENNHFKSLLDSRLDGADGYMAEVIKKLESEIDSLNDELERAKQAEEKLVIMESLIERLSADADNAKSAELNSLKSADEWKKKAEFLEIQLIEARHSEKSSSESQVSLAKQLEVVNASLQDAESETAVLKGKVESLVIEVADVNKAKLDSDKQADQWKKKAEFLELQLADANQFRDSLASVTDQLEDSNSSLQDVLSENASLRVKIESLEVELTRHKDLMDTATCEKVKAASDEESFSDERSKLLKELEIARQEGEKAKKAMEGLASALQERSAEAREAQEKLFAKRVEHEDAHAQIEQLRSAHRNTEENYEVMLDETRYEIVCLKKVVQKLETEVKVLRNVGNLSEKLASFETKMEMDENKVEEGEKKMEIEEEKLDTLELAERLLDTENELEIINKNNVEVMIQEAASTDKFNESPRLLSEATSEKHEQTGELSNSEKEYDMLPNSKEIPMESVNGGKEGNPKPGEELNLKEENGNGHQYLGEEEPVKVEVKMLEGYKASENDRDLSIGMGNEEETIDHDLELKLESGRFGSFDYTNGLPSEIIEDGSVSPTKQQQHQQQQKKKRHLFKFSNLLKKKSTQK